MGAGQSKSVGLEQRLQVELVPFAFKVTIKGNTTAASITTFSDVGGDILVYNENTAANIPASSGLNSGTALDVNAAPAIIGIYMNVGDALEVASISVDAGSIYATGGTAMTAGVITRKGNDSTRPGILSTTKGICFQVSCTTLDADAAIQDNSFWVFGAYVRDLRQ